MDYCNKFVMFGNGYYYEYQTDVYKDVVIKKLIFSAFYFIVFSCAANSAEISAIAHPSAAELELSKLELRRIFSKRVTSWPNGQPIVVFVLPSNHPIHQRFSKEVLKIFPYQLDRIWNKITYSGVGTAPVVIDNYELLIKEIKKTPGAIGYGEAVSQNGGLHVIKIKE